MFYDNFVAKWCIIFSLVGCSSGKIYEGKCKNINSIESVAKVPFGLYWAAFSIPFEAYQQDTYFFPNRDNQSAEVYSMAENYPMFFLLMTYSTSNSLRVGSYFNKITRKNELFVVHWRESFDNKYMCEINKDISTLVFAYSDAILIWGCVDLQGTNQHEETLWLFVKNYEQNKTAMAAFKEAVGLFAKYKEWTMEQLKEISSIPKIDFDYFFEEKKCLYMKDIFQLSGQLQCAAIRRFVSVKLLLLTTLCFGFFSLAFGAFLMYFKN